MNILDIISVYLATKCIGPSIQVRSSCNMTEKIENYRSFKVYFLTGFGHQAVIVFFVLSGFLISSSVFKAGAEGKWSWVDYGINRAARLYVVLIPGLLFGLLWDYLGSHYFALSGLYSRPLETFHRLDTLVQTALHDRQLPRQL